MDAERESKGEKSKQKRDASKDGKQNESEDKQILVSVNLICTSYADVYR